MPSNEIVAPLAPVLRDLIENSNLELGMMEQLESLLAFLAEQYGVQLSDIQIARTCINPDAAQGQEKNYRYDAAFPDPHPDGSSQSITLKAFMARNWQPVSHTRYSDPSNPEIDQFARPVGATIASHDPEDVFGHEPEQVMSQSARREQAKKQADLAEMASRDAG